MRSPTAAVAVLPPLCLCVSVSSSCEDSSCAELQPTAVTAPNLTTSAVTLSPTRVSSTGTRVRAEHGGTQFNPHSLGDIRVTEGPAPARSGPWTGQAVLTSLPHLQKEAALWAVPASSGLGTCHRHTGVTVAILSGLGTKGRPYLFVRETLTPGPWQEGLGQGCEGDQRPAPALRLPGPPRLTTRSSVGPAAGAPRPAVPAGEVPGVGLGSKRRLIIINI